MNSYLHFINLFEELSIENFKKNYWTQKFLFKRSKPEKYESLLSIRDLDEILTVRIHDKIELVKNSILVPREEHHHGHDKQKIFELFNNGYSIILSQLNKNWEPLRNLCLSVYDEIDFLKNVYANVYLTPSKSQGLSKHADLQDVFILQVYGSKRWKLFNQDFNHPTSKDQLRRNSDQIEKSELIFDETLVPGDLLYIPRGMIHEVFTSDQSSAHITLTIETYTNIDLIVDFLLKSAHNKEQLRRTISADYYSNKGVYFENLLKSSIKDIPDFISRNRSLVEEIKPNPNANFKEHLLNLEKVQFIGQNSEISKRKHIDSQVTRDGSAYVIICGGEKLEIEEAEEEMHFINKVKSDFKPNEIPGISSIQLKIELVKSLIEIGYLSILKV